MLALSIWKKSMMSRKTHSEIIDRALESHGIKQQRTERKAKALRWAVIPLAPFDNLRVFGFTPAGEPRLCVAYKIDEKDQKIEGYE